MPFIAPRLSSLNTCVNKIFHHHHRHKTGLSGARGRPASEIFRRAIKGEMSGNEQRLNVAREREMLSRAGYLADAFDEPVNLFLRRVTGATGAH